MVRSGGADCEGEEAHTRASGRNGSREHIVRRHAHKSRLGALNLVCGFDERRDVTM